MSEQEIYDAKRDWESQQVAALLLAERQSRLSYRWFRKDWGRVADHFRYLQLAPGSEMNKSYFRRLIRHFEDAAPNQTPELRQQYTDTVQVLQQMIGG